VDDDGCGDVDRAEEDEKEVKEKEEVMRRDCIILITTDPRIPPASLVNVHACTRCATALAIDKP
jgi:hypothetical protein